MDDSPPDGEEASDDGEYRLFIESYQLAGVWANLARVTHGPYEFTLDFYRVDYSKRTTPRPGILVARIGASPRFMLDLMDALSREWSSYAEGSLPREVRGDEGTEDQDRDHPLG